MRVGLYGVLHIPEMMDGKHLLDLVGDWRPAVGGTEPFNAWTAPGFVTAYDLADNNTSVGPCSLWPDGDGIALFKDNPSVTLTTGVQVWPNGQVFLPRRRSGVLEPPA